MKTSRHDINGKMENKNTYFSVEKINRKPDCVNWYITEHLLKMS